MNSTPKYLQIANYIISNQCGKDSVCKHFAITRKNLSDHLKNLKKSKHQGVYRNVYNILNGLPILPTINDKTPKYIKYAVYIIENGANYEDTAYCFGTSYEAVASAINHSLQDNDYALYQWVKKSLKENKNRKSERYGLYMLNHNKTIKDIAKRFDVPVRNVRSNIYNLKKLNPKLYSEIKKGRV